MKKLKIGMIGTLHDHAEGKLSCVKKYPDIFEVVGIVPDSDRRIAQMRAQGYENFTFLTEAQLSEHPTFRDCRFLTEEQLLNAGCDCIMTEGFEYDIPHTAKRCIEAGIPVHADKPAGNDLPVFVDTLRLAKQKGLPLQMAYMYRYNPAVQDCLARVREGSLGEILSVSAVMNIEHPADKRHWHGIFDAGMMFFLGCHMVDLVHMMQGIPEKITPYLTASRLDGNSSLDQSTAIFEYPRGVSLVQSNSTEINGFQRRQLIVSGSLGTYEIRPLEWQPKAILSIAGKKGEELSYPPISGRYDAMMLDFASMVRGEKENAFDYIYELDTQRLLFAACGYNSDFKSEIIL